MKKKGFTLIELLAVIIILAIVALIATPVVLNIIEKIRISAAESSAKGYTKAVEYKIIDEGLFDNISYDGEYDVIDNNLNVSYQGDGPSEGYFIVEKNKVTYGEFCINGYPIKYENSIGKYAPGEILCNGEDNSFIPPEGTIASELCKGVISYDEVTNINIEKAEDLACISYLSNVESKTFEGKTLSLIADIDFNDDNSYRDKSTTQFYKDMNGNGVEEDIKTEFTTEKGFKPIGNYLNTFSGTFDGNSFTISNLYISRTGLNNVGLFGHITDATIEGINVENANISGNDGVGSIVGHIQKGSVIGINIYNTTIKANLKAGGVAGYIYVGTIKEVNCNANITSTGQIGGIVGGSGEAGNNIISVIYNGNLQNKNTESTGAAGIVTWANKSINISGVVESARITGLYVAKAIRGADTENSNLNIYTVKNNIILDGMNSSSISNDIGTDYLYEPTLSGYDGVLDTYIGGDNDSSGYYFDYNESNDIVVKSIEKEPLIFKLKGEGTIDNPYIISNAKDWKQATLKVKGGYYFKISNDIDFKDENYYMMGSTSNPFYGYIDGNYKTLSNIYLSGTNNIGIIGYNNDGVIEGINIEGANINGNDGIGSVVGHNQKGSIIGINIYNTTIKGTGKAGGVAGFIYIGTIKEINCNANITSTGQIGGIAGGSGEAGNNIISVIYNGNLQNKNTESTGAAGIVTWANKSINISGVVESARITGLYVAKAIRGADTENSNLNIYTVKNNIILDGMYSSSISNDIGTDYLYEPTLSGYDGVLDTYIGGDNDSSGYYFDYNESNDIVVKSIKVDPLTLNLTGNGTQNNPYIINNYEDWKKATAYVSKNLYFKLNNDIDFKDKNYYMMGSDANPFKGYIDGNYKTLSNIFLTGINNIGIIGYTDGGTIKGLNIVNSNIYGNDNVGTIVGYNINGSVIGINIYNATIKSTGEAGGVVGYSYLGNIKEINCNANITSTGHVGGILGYSGNANNNIIGVIYNGNVINNNKESTGASGLVGWAKNTLSINGVLEGGTISGTYVGRILRAADSTKISNNVYVVKNNVLVKGTVNSAVTGKDFTSNITLENYDAVLETILDGDLDNSGYYFDYDESGTEIIVVPVGGIIGNNPSIDNPDSKPTIEIDSNYTMTNIVGTTDMEAPTCELYYVVPVSNGIRASFSCTDDQDVPDVRSLFDSTTEKSAATFDTIGTLKLGSVSGNTKTVVSTWNTNNEISQPTPGTCYYFRYGGQDAEGNFSTYVTNICYTGFSN